MIPTFPAEAKTALVLGTDESVADKALLVMRKIFQYNKHHLLQ
jgi:hypothetical protein